MMTAVKPAPGCREAFAAPAPEVCPHCGGSCEEPECEGVPCLACDALGVLAPVEFALPRSRTHELRVVRYMPTVGVWGFARGRLWVGAARKATHRLKWDEYAVRQMNPDWPGAAFVCAKVGDPDRSHNLFLGADETTCSCEGETFLSAAKANQRAWNAHEEIYPTMGCRHLDSVSALLLGGWFKL